METLFQMQLQFSFAVIVVMILRIGLKRFPKIYSYMLWSIIFLRLLFPISIESKWAVVPSDITTSTYMQLTHIPKSNQKTTDTGKIAVHEATKTQEKNESITSAEQNNMASSPKQNSFPWKNLMLIIWGIGILIYFGYNGVSLYRLKKRVIHTQLVKDNIYETNQIVTPFVLGIFRSKIYLPAALSPKEREYIICHEQVHIHRKDYWIKNIVFALTGIYWFNPFVWIAFHFMEQDMEMSCDEQVIHIMGNDIKKPYSQSLLNFASGNNKEWRIPLTFSEIGVKQRIKNILTKKKVKIWMPILGILLCGGLLFGSFTIKTHEEKTTKKSEKTIAETTKIPKATQTPKTEPKNSENNEENQLTKEYGFENINALEDTNYQQYQEKYGNNFLDEYFIAKDKHPLHTYTTGKTFIISIFVGYVDYVNSGFVLISNGTWDKSNPKQTRYISTKDKGYTSIYLGNLDGQDYLMDLHIEDEYTYGSYDYVVYTMDDEGELICLDGSSFSWGENYLYDDDKRKLWIDKLSVYLKNSRLILSTQSESDELIVYGECEVEKYTYDTLKPNIKKE